MIPRVAMGLAIALVIALAWAITIPLRAQSGQSVQSPTVYELQVQIADLKVRAERAEELSVYLDSQMKFFKAQVEALVVILNRMQSCISAGNVPGFSKDPRTEGRPTCEPRAAPAAPQKEEQREEQK